MSAQEEENKAPIHRLVEEVYNQDDLDVLDELLAPDFVNHYAVPEHGHGIEGFKHVNRWVRAGFSDAHYEVEDMIAEADRVACRITLTGTHDGEFQGSPLPASGSPWITATGTAWPTGSWSSAGPWGTI